MDLKTYLSPMTTEAREAFATRCGTTRGHLQNIAFYGKSCSPALAVALERETEGVITRRVMRPKDWLAIWPELDRRKTARTPSPTEPTTI